MMKGTPGSTMIQTICHRTHDAQRLFWRAEENPNGRCETLVGNTNHSCQPEIGADRWTGRQSMTSHWQPFLLCLFLLSVFRIVSPGRTVAEAVPSTIRQPQKNRKPNRKKQREAGVE